MPETHAQPAHFVHVDLGSRSYRVDVGRGLLKNLGAVADERFRERKACVVITDSKVGPLYAATAVDSLKAAGRQVTLITVPSGEASKSLIVAEQVCGEMARGVAADGTDASRMIQSPEESAYSRIRISKLVPQPVAGFVACVDNLIKSGAAA